MKGDFIFGALIGIMVGGLSMWIVSTQFNEPDSIHCYLGKQYYEKDGDRLVHIPNSEPCVAIEGKAKFTYSDDSNTG